MSKPTITARDARALQALVSSTEWIAKQMMAGGRVEGVDPTFLGSWIDANALLDKLEEIVAVPVHVDDDAARPVDPPSDFARAETVRMRKLSP